MTDIKDRIEELLGDIKQESEALRIKLNLAGKDLSDEWNMLEEKMAKLESKARQLGGATKEASKDVGTAAKLLAEEILKGYEKIRKQL